MEKLENTFCRLCLSYANDEHFKVIDETVREALDVLLLKLSVEQDTKSVICNACFVKLFAAFEFKITCMNTEDSIIPHVNSDNEELVDLIKIYRKERGKERLEMESELENICRLCLQAVTYGFTWIKDVDTDLFFKYIPEINFTYTKEPVICSECLDSLNTHSSFLNNCLDQHENIKYIFDDKDAVSSLYVKSEEIEIKFENVEDRSTSPYNNDKLTGIKTEEEDDLQSDHIKNEDSLDAEMYSHRTWEYETTCTDHFTCKNPSKVQVYTCDTCDYRTKLKYNLTRHQLKHTNTSELKVFKCDKCDYESDQKSYLTCHQLIHSELFTGQMYKCDSCTYDTKHKSCLIIHQHKDIPQVPLYKCNSCEFVTKYKGSIAVHQLKHISKMELYKCDVCSYKTKYKNGLVIHQLSHVDISEVPLYKCDQCDFRTKYKNSLSLHQFQHKDVSKTAWYRCDKCNFKTNNKAYLKDHMVHHRNLSKIKMYKCDLCDYKTKRTSCLRSHQLKHKDFSEVPLYTCDLCSFKTKRKNTLERHRVTHHHPSDVQMQKCEICGFETKHKFSLNRHKAQHKEQKKKRSLSVNI